jgi:glutamyl-tRNA reductase
MVGCSHHNSPVELRERLAFNGAQIGDALSRLRRAFPGTEAVLLSTCNRLEVYTAAEEPHGGPNHQQVVEFLAGYHKVAVAHIFDDLFERHDEDAVRHLFYVASSLDSMVVGEAQIGGQVRQAYETAVLNQCAGPLTNLIFQAAFKTARRVASETSINQKRVSIPSVAVADFASQIFERFNDKKVLVIGAGEMGEETLTYLREKGVRDVIVVNRHPERAVALAQRCAARAADWQQLHALIVEADLIVSTTGASRPIVNLDDYHRIEAARHQRPLFILDLAVPRDFEPSIGGCLGVYLYSIDDLRAVCEENLAQRERELPAATRIVEQETARFMADWHHRATAPTIKRLKHNWERIKQDELRRLLNKLEGISEPARRKAEISRAFDRLVNKMLHPPLESLRDEARHGPPHGLIAALKQLFQLRE